MALFVSIRQDHVILTKEWNPVDTRIRTWTGMNRMDVFQFLQPVLLLTILQEMARVPRL